MLWIFIISIICIVIFSFWRVIIKKRIQTKGEYNNPIFQIDIEKAKSLLPNTDSSNNEHYIDEISQTSKETIQTKENNSNLKESTFLDDEQKRLKELDGILKFTPKKKRKDAYHIFHTVFCAEINISKENKYELAKVFAEKIAFADNLRNQGKFSEEIEFCLQSIKWCAKNGLSVIYWQCRLNQVNKLLGRHTLTRIDIPTMPSVIIGRHTYIKVENERLKRAYKESLLRDDLEEADRINKKALAWAKETEQFYWKQAWVKFTEVAHKEAIAEKQKKRKKNKKKKSSNKQNDASPTTECDAVAPIVGEKKKKRPRIYIHKSILLEKKAK